MLRDSAVAGLRVLSPTGPLQGYAALLMIPTGGTLQHATQQQAVHG